jgi:carbon-monoxide dehydrogenase small subunit
MRAAADCRAPPHIAASRQRQYDRSARGRIAQRPHDPGHLRATIAPRRAGRNPEEIPVSATLSLTVNGKAVSATIDPRTLLVDFLRQNLGLTGVHVGCDTAQCGACTVHLDGRAVKSCNVLAMQAAFRECHGLQCGFCTPGMVMSALDLCARHPHADEATIRAELEGNLCRCTGYHNIVKAVKQGAAAMGQEARHGGE